MTGQQINCLSVHTMRPHCCLDDVVEQKMQSIINTQKIYTIISLCNYAVTTLDPFFQL